MWAALYFITIIVIIWTIKHALKKGATLDLAELVWIIIISLIPIINTLAVILSFFLTVDWDKTVIDTRKDT